MLSAHLVIYFIFIIQYANSNSFSDSIFPYVSESLLVGELADTTQKPLSIIVLGASGDLAKKKTFPSLWALYREGLLPKETKIYGMARAVYSDEEFRVFLSQNIKTNDTNLEQFKSICYYSIAPSYSAEVFKEFSTNILKKSENGGGNRLFYLALPPSVFVVASTGIKQGGISAHGWNRVVVEKPFGHDAQSSSELSSELAKLFHESELYRIDHYLGKEMVQNILVFRFANVFFEPLWNNNYISSIKIVMEEQIGTEGRGGYFDNYGIIRDVIQNHLMQLLSLVAMDAPVSLEAEHVRDKKVEVLRSVPEIKSSDAILGQYIADKEGKNLGYKDDKGVPSDSTTPTFAQVVAWVNTPRWQGVPFILKAAKAVQQKSVEIRIRFKNKNVGLFQKVPNELVIRVQPEERIFLRVLNKEPGLTSNMVMTELDLKYSEKFNTKYLPDAYDRLILDVIRGNHQLFVRDDELSEAWRICTPLLHEIDQKKYQPFYYEYGSQGPSEADQQEKEL